MAIVKSGQQTARLITINHAGKSYDIIPGDSAQVPNAAVKIPFVQSLISEGSLIVTDVGEDEDDGLDLLRAQAEALGIKVDKRWKAEKLQAAIEDATNKE